jgi:acyl carrier protein
MIKTSNEKVLEIIIKISNLTDLKMNQLLLDEGIIDSLSTIELISELEEIYEIVIGPDDLNHYNFNSVEAICKLVNSKL